MNLVFYALIGGALGWLVGWSTDRKGAAMAKPVGIGVGGALAGGLLIHFLITAFKALAPMVGAGLGALVLLSFVTKRGAVKLSAK